MNNNLFLNKLIEYKKTEADLNLNYEANALIDIELNIKYSNKKFDKLFDVNSSNDKEVFHSTNNNQADQIKKLFDKSIKSKKFHKAMFFHYIDKFVLPRVIDINPIMNPVSNELVVISVTAYEYKEYSILFNLLKQNHYNAHLKEISVKNSNLLLSKLTKSQITICYLIAHKYANADIAEIMNLLDNKHATKQTTRSSINKQIEKIRDIFALPSKDALVDYIVSLGFHNILPPSLFKNEILILE